MSLVIESLDDHVGYLKVERAGPRLVQQCARRLFSEKSFDYGRCVERDAHDAQCAGLLVGPLSEVVDDNRRVPYSQSPRSRRHP